MVVNVIELLILLCYSSAEPFFQKNGAEACHTETKPSWKLNLQYCPLERLSVSAFH